MAERTWSLVPQTALGKWSVWLLVATPILFVSAGSFSSWLYAEAAPGGTILADISARPALALTMLAGMTAGVAAFVTGLLAIIRRRDRALLVVAATAIGALLLLFLAGELIFPH